MIAYTGNSQILPDIEGVYYFEYGIDNFNLSINADSTFEITNMISDTVKGRWKLVNDSLFVETFLQESIVEKFDENRNDKIVRVRNNFGFCIQTIIMINGTSIVKNTNKECDLTFDIDTIKSIKVLDGEYPIFNISNYNANDITIYFKDEVNGSIFPKIFKQSWLVNGDMIYAWRTKEGSIEMKKYFKKVNKRRMNYYKLKN